MSSSANLSANLSTLQGWAALPAAQKTALATALGTIPGEGVRISELPRVTELTEEDIFLFGKTDLSSYSITRRALADQLEIDIAASLGIKSMAYRETWEYAKADHTHLNMYNKLHTDYWNASSGEVTTRFEDTAADTKVVARLSVWNGGYFSDYDTHATYSPQIVELAVPVVAKPKLPGVPIGTLKFIGKSTLGTIDINSASFDGWVYPDGTRYTVGTGNFQLACQIYGGGSDSGEFTVPDLREFFKCCGYSASALSKTETNWNSTSAMLAHSHSFSQDAKLALTGTATMNSGVSIKTTKDFGGMTADHVHNGKGTMTPSEYACSIDASSIGFSGTLNTSATSQNGSTHPSYNLLPVLVYIGLKN